MLSRAATFSLIGVLTACPHQPEPGVGMTGPKPEESGDEGGPASADSPTDASTGGSASTIGSGSSSTDTTVSATSGQPNTTSGPVADTTDGDETAGSTPADACHGVFGRDWCRQIGTRDQFTRCGGVEDDGTTCIAPEIRYGTTEGGIPGVGPTNELDTWCVQLGFAGAVEAVFGDRDCSQPRGRLYGCAGYDEPAWHWCDLGDGYWRDQTLDFSTCELGLNNELVQITCYH